MNISLNGIPFGSNPLKAKRQSFGIMSLIIMLVIAIGFIGIGSLAVNLTKIDPSWTKLNGQVVSLTPMSGSNGSTTYAPVVQYIVDNQPYRVTSGSSSSIMPAIGSTRQIAYNPTQPSEAKVVDNTASLLVWIFPIIGVLLLILAPFLFIRSRKRTADINSLVHTGQKLQGIIVDIRSNTSAVMNGMPQGGIGTISMGSNNGSTYKLVVAASYNGTTQNYVSDSLTGIGGLAMADFRSQPIPIDVYVNPSNPQDYYVDVSEVPNLTGDRIAQLIKSAVAPQSQAVVPAAQSVVAAAPAQLVSNPTAPVNPGTGAGFAMPRSMEAVTPVAAMPVVPVAAPAPVAPQPVAPTPVVAPTPADVTAAPVSPMAEPTVVAAHPAPSAVVPTTGIITPGMVQSELIHPTPSSDPLVPPTQPPTTPPQ